MGYVKMDDGLPDHPKIAVAGPLAGWLYFCGIAYCNRLMTDGFIPTAQVSRLADMRGIEDVAAVLVAARLWEPVEGGYRVHDYLEHQSSREHILEVRAARQESGKRGGIRKAENRSSKLLDDQAQAGGGPYQIGTGLLKQNPGKKKNKNEGEEIEEEDRLIHESERNTNTARARVGDENAPSALEISAKPDYRSAQAAAWWDECLRKQAGKTGIPLGDLAGLIDVAEETAKWEEEPPATRPPWSRWMRKAIDFAVRDWNNGVRPAPGPGLNRAPYSPQGGYSRNGRLGYAENESRKLREAAALIAALDNQ